MSKYPKPPFKGQLQPWPGLAGKMEPKLDHGETSYKGSGRLKERKVLITGGHSGMGRAAIIVLCFKINYQTELPGIALAILFGISVHKNKCNQLNSLSG